MEKGRSNKDDNLGIGRAWISRRHRRDGALSVVMNVGLEGSLHEFLLLKLLKVMPRLETGDDVIIANDQVKDRYLGLITQLGVSTSPAKSITGRGVKAASHSMSMKPSGFPQKNPRSMGAFHGVYTLYRPWMQQYLEYSKWYSLMSVDVGSKLEKLLEPPSYIPTWFAPKDHEDDSKTWFTSWYTLIRWQKSSEHKILDVRVLLRKLVLLFTCSENRSRRKRAYGGDEFKPPSFLISLTRTGYPRIIPAFDPDQELPVYGVADIMGPHIGFLSRFGTVSFAQEIPLHLRKWFRALVSHKGAAEFAKRFRKSDPPTRILTHCGKGLRHGHDCGTTTRCAGGVGYKTDTSAMAVERQPEANSEDRAFLAKNYQAKVAEEADVGMYG
ncbi:hypothetical protein M569_00061 [Genlisea aurea]|uniref:Uncharacterized protein n=1 Tax=Genlisea aurea TaxID=192259 RepID=S8DAZ0_9LAMI|nr:hypothetical protein M569_00061 [Genlisea aurea]